MGLGPGQVAQLVEQRTENPCVGGSIPPLATTDLRFSLSLKFFVMSCPKDAGGL